MIMLRVDCPAHIGAVEFISLLGTFPPFAFTVVIALEDDVVIRGVDCAGDVVLMEDDVAARFEGGIDSRQTGCEIYILILYFQIVGLSYAQQNQILGIVTLGIKSAVIGFGFLDFPDLQIVIKIDPGLDIGNYFAAGAIDVLL